VTPEPSAPGAAEGVLFSASPVAMSFIFRYIASFTPVALVIICIFVRGILDALVLASSHLVPVTVPVTPGAHAVSSAAMTQYTGMLNSYTVIFGDAITISILLLAPVGIFLLVAIIGESLGLAEMWTGVTLTILLSGLTAFLLAGSPSFTMSYAVLVLQWVAFLVQPFAILASLLAFWGSVKFRRSIEYVITPEAVIIRGGIFSHSEQTIPHRHIGSVIFRQDLIGSRYNFGTIIPQVIPLPREGASPGGPGVPWEVISTAAGFLPGGIRATKDPLECLFGIPDPDTARKILEQMINRPSS
jgi:hypothetical protein